MDTRLRTVVDPKEVDPRSKAYDRRFSLYWEKLLRLGVYRDIMARIYDGYADSDRNEPRTDADERQVVDWLSPE